MLIDASENNLLRALRRADAMMLAPYIREQWIEAGTVLYQPGDNVRTVYFPAARSLASFTVSLTDGRGVETALVGREGAVGGIVSQGRLPAYSHCVVQFSGPFYCMASAELEQMKMQSMPLRYLFARYADCLLAQVFQSVACNAVHSLEQRTAKWLIAAIERTGDNEIPLTQEQMASMLGVGRSYLSRIIRSLKEQGIIGVRRGRLMLRDAEGLQHLACDCHRQVRRHFDEVLSGVYPTEEESAALQSDDRPLLAVVR
ncbi:Crp/Fnr family transcriptional regulator [Sphingomonas sp. GlSt437]|uniref:Crp/Fnr family transcriptional regulator n=1 Tax=Sphingomonas sp. GlSt437 TaxID=3389970 RepID=UPI003A8C137C